MKATVQTIIFAATIIFSQLASAVQIEAARVNLDKNVIEMDVVYSGGCEEHSISLELKTCSRTSPLTCVANVVDSNKTDVCRSVIATTVEVSAGDYISELQLTDLIITGSEDTAVHLEIY